MNNLINTFNILNFVPEVIILHHSSSNGPTGVSGANHLRVSGRRFTNPFSKMGSIVSRDGQSI